MASSGTSPRQIKRNHERAFELWDTGIMEAQFIASVTADPKRFTAEDARQWASSFDSWDIVDGVSDLFVDTDAWRDLIGEFAEDEREFVRRTAFAMMAWSVVHRKKEPEQTFLDFLPLIEAHATDNRNFVRKAVNWALRQIGKRSNGVACPCPGARRKTGCFRGQDGALDRQGRGAGNSPIRSNSIGWPRKQGNEISR